MDQNLMSQVSTALQFLSADLDRLQTILTNYETKMVDSERVTPQLKEIVASYRTQTANVRSEVLALCSLLSGSYKNRVIVTPELPAPKVVSKPAPVEAEGDVVDPFEAEPAEAPAL
jgi:hypothetical protein